MNADIMEQSLLPQLPLACMSSYTSSFAKTLTCIVQ